MYPMQFTANKVLHKTERRRNRKRGTTNVEAPEVLKKLLNVTLIGILVYENQQQRHPMVIQNRIPVSALFNLSAILWTSLGL